MSKRFQVPSHILGDQAVRLASLYRNDTGDNRDALAEIGITDESIGEVEGLGFHSTNRGVVTCSRCSKAE